MQLYRALRVYALARSQDAASRVVVALMAETRSTIVSTTGRAELAGYLLSLD